MSQVKASSRAAQREATRERVFAAAISEFTRTGSADADIAAVVAEAGVAHGTFFFHFPTKEHVVAELGQREEARMGTELARYLAEPHPLPETLARVTRMSVALERRVGTILFKEILALFFTPDRPALEVWTEHPVIDLVIAEFRRASSDLDDDGVDPENRAIFFLLGLYGLLLVQDRGAGRAGLLDQFIATVLGGMEV